MRKWLKSKYNIYFLLLGFTTLVYVVLKTHLFYKLPFPVGDEISFLKVHDSIERIGFLNTWKQGNFSPLWFILGYPLSLLTPKALLGYRFLSLVFSILSICVLYRWAVNTLKLQGYIIASFFMVIVTLTASSFYYQGINDSLLKLLIILCYLQLYKSYQLTGNYAKALVIVGLFLGLALSTRIFAVLMIPGILLLLLRFRWNAIAAVLTALMVVFVMHAPSIFYAATLASVSKIESTHGNWYELNYASQLARENGLLSMGERLNWDALNAYKRDTGNAPLPQSHLAMLTSNPMGTLKLLAYNVYFFLSHIFIYFLPLTLVLIPKVVKDFSIFKSFRNPTFNTVFLYNALCYLFIISTVAYTQIEIRWLLPLLYISILLLHEAVAKEFSSKYNKLFICICLIPILYLQLKFILTDSNLFSDAARSYIKTF